MSVQKLKAVTTEADTDVVARLENALMLAKSGQLRSVAIVGELTGNDMYTSLETKDFIPLLGMLAYLQHRIAFTMENHIEEM